MRGAGNPGATEVVEGVTGWQVGQFRPASTPVIDHGDVVGSKGQGPLPLFLLTDGRFAILREVTEIRRGLRKAKTRTTLNAGQKYGMPERSAVNPFFQLLETLPPIAAAHGIELQPQEQGVSPKE